MLNPFGFGVPWLFGPFFDDDEDVAVHVTYCAHITASVRTAEIAGSVRTATVTAVECEHA